MVRPAPGSLDFRRWLSRLQEGLSSRTDSGSRQENATADDPALRASDVQSDQTARENPPPVPDPDEAVNDHQAMKVMVKP